MLQCFFIGHRDAPQELLPLIKAKVEQLITEHGVTSFLVGNHGHFDALAAEAVISAKERHDGLQLYRLLAYHPAERTVDLPKGFDGSYYPDGMQRVPHRFAIDRVNRIAATESDYIIAYAIYPGCAKNISDYAIRQKGAAYVTLLPHP